MVHRMALNVQDWYDWGSVHEARHNSKEKTTGEKEAGYIEELDDECILSLHWYIIQFLWLIPRYCKEPIKTDSAWVNGYAGKHTAQQCCYFCTVFSTFIEYRLWLLHLQPGAHILIVFFLLLKQIHSKSKVVMCGTVFISNDLKLVTPKNHTGRQLLNK